jgi:hypothetical protein
MSESAAVSVAFGAGPTPGRPVHAIDASSAERSARVESLCFTLPSDYSVGGAYRSNRCCMSPTVETGVWMDG